MPTATLMAVEEAHRLERISASGLRNQVAYDLPCSGIREALAQPLREFLFRCYLFRFV
jgi:hypothetical protein